MPPWHQFRGFLSDEEHGALLDWTLSNRERFKPAKVAGRGVVPETRVADKLSDLGPLKGVFEERLRELTPEVLSRAGSRPFEVEYFELQLAAHGDGAFFKRHSDIPVGPGRKPVGGFEGSGQDRLVSAVYYYHRDPKRFSGGALRLFRFGAADGDGDHVDVEPEQNSLVVFPSWALHEVMPVSVPSGEFADRRFAVNIWLCRTLAAA
jgi:Rps23 Pro-64 3,4-dihydroxylase Tpa1-like proline 4-hydroxylase